MYKIKYFAIYFIISLEHYMDIIETGPPISSSFEVCVVT